MGYRNSLGFQDLEASHLVFQCVLARVGDPAVSAEIQQQSLVFSLEFQKVGGSPARLPTAFDDPAAHLGLYPFANGGLIA
jgi:hypothetical protein